MGAPLTTTSVTTNYVNKKESAKWIETIVWQFSSQSKRESNQKGGTHTQKKEVERRQHEQLDPL